MPPFESFRDAESYAATLAHECVHWTAPAHRVNRDLSRYAKDRSERAREELVAELGACFLSADLGIVPELEPRADHASYLASWLEVLANDRRFIFSAAAHAQRAVTYLHESSTEAGRDRRGGVTRTPSLRRTLALHRSPFSESTKAPPHGGAFLACVVMPSAGDRGGGVPAS